ncbi:MAG: alpha-2-macroglobulin family protein, partial [Bacteroidota bacterium]
RYLATACPNLFLRVLRRRTFNNYAFANVMVPYTRRNYGMQFYIPQYDAKNPPKIRDDFRQTIYWNPVVQTDEEGKAELSFYNSDAITSFKIVAEGIGFNGLVGRQEKAYATKKLLSLDLKTPNYMVVNDTIALPISIKNESEEAMEVKLSAQLPDNLMLLDTTVQRFEIAGNTTLVRHLMVRPIKKADKAEIGLALEAENQVDYLKKEVIILSPFYPTEVSITGQENQIFQFELDHIVEGSLKANFSVYTDIIGAVMDGIEGIIRKPYGCFEQTSSSTYPNIMVLKYLRETNKSKPEIEQKALDFIEAGYNRLVGFETSLGGFEWFGNTPPHETLTAYGILEFTEMKEVYPAVSQKMIERTVKWLMKRRDGQGGFKKSTKGYDSFASSPADIANDYIVYALSEAKVVVDLQKEYQRSYQEALKSRDSYRMALACLASFNFSKQENAAELLSQIKDQIYQYGFEQLPVKNTIVRSYGNTKSIETAAFTLLALMRQEQPEEALLKLGIDYLLSQRQYGRFGSTQSTCLSLKALIEYTKLKNKQHIQKTDAVQLVCNSEVYESRLEQAANGKLSIENLAANINRGVQEIEVSFSNKTTTLPYTLDIIYDRYLPASSPESMLDFKTVIDHQSYGLGDNISLKVEVRNKTVESLGMVTAIIGFPSGTSPQPWQLKQLVEEQQVAYYETFNNYLVFYWRSMLPNEVKKIRIDLKAEIPGSFQAPASTAYLYYGDEHKVWIPGNRVRIYK